MKDRIKKIRKELDLTQQEFADKIGVKRGGIANYENGRNQPIDAVIALMCREFNVNEEWLRTGTGEMFIKMDKEDLLTKWTVNVLGNESDTFKRNFIKMLMSLTENEWEFLESKAKEIVNDEKEKAEDEMDIAALVEEYR